MIGPESSAPRFRRTDDTRRCATALNGSHLRNGCEDQRFRNRDIVARRMIDLSPAQIHLAVNHLPVVGALLATGGAGRRLSAVALLAAFAATGLMVQTAHLGGQIRHDELRAQTAAHAPLHAIEKARRITFSTASHSGRRCSRSRASWT